MRHGSQLDPPNRFAKTHAVPDPDHWEHDEAHFDAQWNRRIEYLTDASRSIVSENDSPDIPFRYSVNPYRGCAHGCSYWYEPPKPVEPLYFPAFFEFGGRTRELTFARSTR